MKPVAWAVIIASVLAIVPSMVFAAPLGCQTASNWTQDGHRAYFTTTITPINWQSARLIQTLSDDRLDVWLNGVVVYNETLTSCNPDEHSRYLNIPIAFTNGVPFSISTQATCPCGCGEANAMVRYEYTYCTDFDGDGYASTYFGGNDCNDMNASINPGMTDVPNNGIDEDCSGTDLVVPIMQCQDGVDNDGDGLVDMADPGCLSITDNTENTATSQCQDGIDNDNDGVADFPADISCSSLQDNDESNPKTQCQDGLDNDGDGAIDYPNDFSCSSTQDNDETNAQSQCQDGVDNDGNTFTDYPNDRGCASLQDNTESGYNPDISAPAIVVNAIPSSPSSSEMVSFSANANDNVRVAWTRVYVDGAKVCEQQSSSCVAVLGPYRPGQHPYYATATDTSGNMATSAVQLLTVSTSQPQDTNSPVIDISHYPGSPSTSDNATISATASDPSPIASVKVYVDNVNVRTCSTHLCVFSAQYAAGIHFYYAEAFDSAGNRGVSEIKSFVVSGSPVQPPSSQCGVEITSFNVDSKGNITFAIKNTAPSSYSINYSLKVNTAEIQSSFFTLSAGASANFSRSYDFSAGKSDVKLDAVSFCGATHSLTITHWVFENYKCTNPLGIDNEERCDYSTARFMRCTGSMWVSQSQSTYCNNCPNHCGDGICSCLESYSSCPHDCSSSCTPGNLDTYACDGSILQRGYRYSNCTVDWRADKYCSNGCYNGACIDQPSGNCGVQITSFDYISQVMKGSNAYVTVTTRNKGGSTTRINTSVYSDGILKGSSYKDVSAGADFMAQIYYNPGQTGTHSITVKSKAGCGSEDSREAFVNTITSGSQPSGPYQPPSTPAARTTSVAFYPSFIDTLPQKSRIIGISITSASPQYFTISASGLPGDWLQYENRVLVDDEKNAYVYVKAAEIGNYTINVSAFAESEKKAFSATIPLFVTTESSIVSQGILGQIWNWAKESAKYMLDRPLMIIGIVILALIVVLLIGHRHLKREKWPLSK